ncbi:MAG TPA: hypothetical protein VK454_09675 [Myxococcaceae bacterium]|nr:hypothetical protein [Myxococcaceae bacterium]
MFRCAVLLVLLVAPATARGQADAGVAENAPVEPQSSPWNFGASISGYIFPSQKDYAQPVVTVDHSFLHLEGRYNYEAQQTGSLWVGWNFEWGTTVTFALTPIVGGVFGSLNGLGAGAEWTLAWGPLSWSSQLELVFDFADSSGDFLYIWSEWVGQPVSWLQLGFSIQRTRTVAEPRWVQWGPLLGFSVWKLYLTGYWFNPGQSNNQYWVVTLGASF